MSTATACDMAPTVLDEHERQRIAARLGAGLVGLALLLLGSLLIRMRPDQPEVGELCRAIAAVIVAAPTLISGLRGIAGGETRRATDQLVALAVLASAATGHFITATLIPLFLEIGRLFEERSSLGARAAIDGIRALSARYATRWHGGVETRVDPSTLAIDDEILVRPGERIAVDGTVIEGRASIDQSAITGESMYEDVAPGSPVFAGSVALDGLLRIRVRGSGADTVLGKVVQLLAEVERTSVPLLRMFERRASVWLPLIVTIAGTTLYFTEDLSRAITVLVVAAPTALVVAGPAAVVASMTVAARLRILIKSVDFLERATDIDTLILDKTGTVTVGMPTVTDVESRPGATQAEVLRIAAACAFGSLHPVSRAVVAHARELGIEITAPASVQEHPGRGVTATIGGQTAWLGRQSFLAEQGVELHAPDADGSSEVWVALGGAALGRIRLRDQPRAEARQALDAMRALGVTRLILLTGDRKATADAVGDVLGVDEVIAEVLPAQKLEVVRAEQAAGHAVMMVGDGVNDAPALGGADIGVAIGAELNEVALGGADVALLGTDLRRLPQLIGLADVTRHVLNQNLWLSFALSVVLIGFAATGVLSPLTGALAQSAAVLAVVFNSARILHFEKHPTA